MIPFVCLLHWMQLLDMRGDFQQALVDELLQRATCLDFTPCVNLAVS
jgi:hypothetical protein